MQASKQRHNDLTAWLEQQLTEPIIKLQPLAGDASFRRYFRLQLTNHSLIAMDAPPDKEDSRPFVKVAQLFAELGLKVPTILAADLTQGFLLISDLGDGLYFSLLNPQTASRLYLNAIEKLLIIQTCQQPKARQFPPFGYEMLMEELRRFREWYLLKHLNLSLNAEEENILQNSFEELVKSALAQPQVCVHRDYHSRNLLNLGDNEVGILDFQDAVWGPVTYDLVSLLRDCYIDWPSDEVRDWANNYYQLALQAKILNQQVTWEQFTRWFDWMGIQRHLKAIYIFARKFRRDGTSAYLGDIPRTLNYVLTISQQYPELSALHSFLSKRVLPYESDDTSRWPRQAVKSFNRSCA